MIIITSEQRFKENEKLAYYTLHKYFSVLAENEDAKQEALLYLWKACLLYDENKNVAFSTYAIISIKNGVYCKYFRKKKEIFTYSYDKIMSSEEDKETSFIEFNEDVGSNFDEKVLLIEVIKTFSDKERKIIELYSQGYSQNEIALQLNMSQAHISRNIKKVKNKLKKDFVVI